MATLYEITGKYRELYERLSDPEYADFGEAIRETMAECDDDFEHKAENIAKVIKQLDADAEAVKKEVDRLETRKTVFENNAKNLKRRLEQAMLDVNKPKFKTLLYTFYIGNNPPGVDDHDPAKIPAKYFTPQEPVLNKKLLLEDLKKLGKDETIPGAAIRQSSSLKIR